MDELSLLLGRVDDLVYSCTCGKPSFLGFLNEAQASEVKSVLERHGSDYAFFGGYAGAVRVMVRVGGGEYFPITALQTVHSGYKTLTHRDYLGTLMSLGMRRECIGDIIVDESGGCVMFVKSDMAQFIIDNLTRVANDTVAVNGYSGSTDFLESKYEILSFTVASLRLDNFVSEAARCSRSDSAKLIESDKVFVNYSAAQKVSKALAVGDTVSIRGFGKYVVLEQTRTTRSGKAVFDVKHYI